MSTLYGIIESKSVYKYIYTNECLSVFLSLVLVELLVFC